MSEAARKAQISPTPENLERLEKAAKTLRHASTRSAPAKATAAEAERKFKLALGAIAADFTTTAAR